MPERQTCSLPPPGQMAQELARALPAFRRVDWVERTGSTNADLLAMARDAGSPRLARPWLLGTHLQDRGRGRAGRTWQNRAGANLMFSCAFDIFLPPAQLPALSLLAGVGVCRALRGLMSATGAQQLGMKWPNDIQWKLAKLAGILVEVTRAGTTRLAADHHVAIIGIGLNLDDARALSQSLNRQVADWSEVAASDAVAAKATMPELAGAIAMAWYGALNEAVRNGLGDLPQAYAGVDALAGQHINVLHEGRILHAGVADGVNQLGQLVVHTQDGPVPVSVGEVSVRPLAVS